MFWFLKPFPLACCVYSVVKKGKRWGEHRAHLIWDARGTKTPGVAGCVDPCDRGSRAARHHVGVKATREHEKRHSLIRCSCARISSSALGCERKTGGWRLWQIIWGGARTPVAMPYSRVAYSLLQLLCGFRLLSPYSLFLCGHFTFLLVEVWIEAQCRHEPIGSADP